MMRTGGPFRSVIVPAVLAAVLSACGGGGGAGSAPAVVYLDRVALFADDSYVHYSPGSSAAEASNLEAALRAMGYAVTPFTGTTSSEFQSALSGRDILIIPKLAVGDLSQDLDASAKAVITGFVNSGGTLVVFNTGQPGPSNDINLVNSLFTHNIATPMGTITGNIAKNITHAAGTAFEDSGPETLEAVNAVTVLDSLPANARSIYTDNSGNAALALLPEGQGQVVIMGWDWQEARPVGTQDGGWWSALYQTVSMNETLPAVALVSDDAPTPYAGDVVEKLKASGMFAVVDTIDAGAATPALSDLRSYDAVMVYSGIEAGFAGTTAMGNVLADYVDAGGGLVTAYAAVLQDPDYAPGGRYITGNYFLTPLSGFKTGHELAGTIFHADHPVLAGYLTTLDGGVNSGRADTTTVAAGAAEIIEWADGTPLVVTGEINGVRRVDLGFLPVSSDAHVSQWDASTDGHRLLANALSWVADKPVRSFDKFSAAISSQDIPDGGATVSSVITVSGGPASVSQVKITVDISHTANHDLDIYVRSPGGSTVELSTDNGYLGNGYSHVTFDDAAGRQIVDLTANKERDFSGDYMPEQSLAAFMGTDSNGDWILQVTDDQLTETGTLNSWSIQVR